MFIITDYKQRLQDFGLTPEKYEECFSDIVAKVNGETPDVEWADIVEKYDLPMSHVTLRKSCSAEPFGSVFVTQYQKYCPKNISDPDSRPYKTETNINKDGSVSSDKLIELNETDAKNPTTLLLAHGFNPSEWEIISARNSIWNSNTKSGVKNLYASKISVKPKNDVMSMDDIAAWFDRLDRNYSIPRIERSMDYTGGTKCLLIDIADLHMNLQASMFVSGNEYNCDIAEKLFFHVITDILSRTIQYKFSKIIFTVSGDMLNSDNIAGTTLKGTPQVNDVHLFDAYERLCAMTVKAIDLMAEYCPVDVIYVPGNHDMTCGFKLAKYIDAWFRHDDRVTVDYSPLPRKYVKFGKTLFVFAHDGDVKRLPGLIADEGREFWADVETTEVFLQHLHSEQVLLEANNMRIQRLPTISAKSDWTVRKGLSSKRQCKSFIFDLEDGLTDILYTPIR